MKDSWASLHPVVTLLYFLLVLALTMLILHPAVLLISFAGASAYAVYRRGRAAWRFNVVFILPMLLVTALLNPLFNHQGATILTYLWNGNPLTLESIVYGVAAGVMLAAVVSWFSCFNAVMTTDKLVYLCGRLAPGLALVLTMALRFVPRFGAQVKIIAAARQGSGRSMSDPGLLNRVRHGLRVISILVTWALEKAVETAAGMRARGYGLPGRTAFSIFRFDRRDRIALIFLLLGGVYLGLGARAGGLYCRFYPTIKTAAVTPYAVSLFVVFTALCLLPVLVNIMEDFRWEAIRSKI